MRRNNFMVTHQVRCQECGRRLGSSRKKEYNFNMMSSGLFFLTEQYVLCVCGVCACVWVTHTFQNLFSFVSICFVLPVVAFSINACEHLRKHLAVGHVITLSYCYASVCRKSKLHSLKEESVDLFCSQCMKKYRMLHVTVCVTSDFSFCSVMDCHRVFQDVKWRAILFDGWRDEMFTIVKYF